MSLSEQIQRVDGSQNDILKTILKAFGVTIGTEKIDAIADLAEAASNLQADGILSTATKTAFGLTSGASPDDVLAILANAAIAGDQGIETPSGTTITPFRFATGSFNTTGAGHEVEIEIPFSFNPFVFIAYCPADGYNGGGNKHFYIIFVADSNKSSIHIDTASSSEITYEVGQITENKVSFSVFATNFQVPVYYTAIG